MDRWLAALEKRHLADLTFSEVARALRALSSTYVERRKRLHRKSALDSTGKRAAYALYYSPLHFLTVLEVVRALGAHHSSARHLLDWGCGAGGAGAAWATSLSRPPDVHGVDIHPWCVAEATFTYRTFGLIGDAARGDAAQIQVPRRTDAIVAGWMLNELTDTARNAVREQLDRAAGRGVEILIVEPISTRVSPWWPAWADFFARRHGRADEWRFPVELPDLVRRLDRAAGLRHDVLTARTLYLRPQASGPRPQAPGLRR
jgi:hypothetical protein